MCRNQVFLFWQITQDLNKMKQISNTLLNTFVIRKREIFQQKLLNSMVVGAHFLRQNTWFLKNYRALSKFLCGIFYLISIKKLFKNSVHIGHFYINYLSHLNVWLVSNQAPLMLNLRTLPLSYVELWFVHKLFSTIFLSAVEGSLKIFRTVVWGIENYRT